MDPCLFSNQVIEGHIFANKQSSFTSHNRGWSRSFSKFIDIIDFNSPQMTKEIHCTVVSSLPNVLPPEIIFMLFSLDPPVGSLMELDIFSQIVICFLLPVIHCFSLCKIQNTGEFIMYIPVIPVKSRQNRFYNKTA